MYDSKGYIAGAKRRLEKARQMFSFERINRGD